MRIFFAAFAAVAVQPLVLVARLAPDLITSTEPLYGLELFLGLLLVVAAAVVLILGVPTFLLLKRFGRANWSSLAAAGSLLGALPALFPWPRNLEGYSASQSWHGRHVDTYVNGNPTVYAWLSYGENIFYFGLHGLVGALVFYAVWLARSPSSQAAP